MSKKVLLAGLFHETHTFLGGTTGLEDFQRTCGDAILEFRGDSSPMGGVLEKAAEFGWEVVLAVDYRAAPSAMVADEVFEGFWQELNQHLMPSLDAVFLVLHGAMVTPSFQDVEGELLERLRRRLGVRLPIFGVYDLHANFTRRMADHANVLVAYRENPHSDARQAAERGASLLERALQSGCMPRMCWAHPPVMWPPTGTGTADEPMKTLEAMARELEEEHAEFWVVNANAGFAFADTVDTGVSFSLATIGDQEQAEKALQRLCQMAIERREQGNVTDLPLEAVFQRLQPMPEGLTVLVEPSDNIGGGAWGDATGLLRALVARRVANAAIAICDPAAVKFLAPHAVGDKSRVEIGGRKNPFDQGPIELEVELLHRSDGRFTLADRQSHLASMSGDHFEMGPTVVARHEGILILLTSRPTPPFDLNQWRSQGIDPATLSMIGVKAAVAHRRAYDPIAKRMFWVDTPGPCTSRLAQLPYHRIARPIYPLDA